MSEILRNGIPKVIGSAPQEGRAEDCAAIVVTGGTVPWVLRFSARCGNYVARLGGVRIYPSALSRVVAVVASPGAKGFEVSGYALTDSAAGIVQDSLDVHIEGTPARGGPWGVQAIPGMSVLLSRSYRVIGGTNGGPITVTGEVHGWAARATAPGATVTITTLPGLTIGPLPVPALGEINGDALGVIAPVSNWTFTGTSEYMIEYFPPFGETDG